MNKNHTYFNLKDQDDKFYSTKDLNGIEANFSTAGNEDILNTSLQENWISLQVPTNVSRTNVFDVASYILSKVGRVTTIKLQKLVYYCQAWSLVWDESPLFDEKIEAWVNGPVVKDLYVHHKGYFDIDNIPIGNPDKLSPQQINTINSVLEFYGNKPSSWLVELTHNEKPWQDARRGLGSLERGNKEINLSSIMEYYSSL